MVYLQPYLVSAGVAHHILAVSTVKEHVMSRRINMAGHRYGRWVVGDFLGANHNGQTIYMCKCDCGTERPVVAQTLRNGLTLSCGCMKGQAIAVARTAHGHSAVKSTKQKPSRTYGIWMGMHGRCRGSRPADRKYYFDRGIAVCERWNSYENFLEDMGEAPAGYSIDRIDGDGNYEKGNCRWATAAQQSANGRQDNGRAGKVWINDGKKSLTLKPDAAARFVERGWSYGMASWRKSAEGDAL